MDGVCFWELEPARAHESPASCSALNLPDRQPADRTTGCRPPRPSRPTNARPCCPWRRARTGSWEAGAWRFSIVAPPRSRQTPALGSPRFLGKSVGALDSVEIYCDDLRIATLARCHARAPRRVRPSQPRLLGERPQDHRSFDGVVGSRALQSMLVAPCEPSHARHRRDLDVGDERLTCLRGACPAGRRQQPPRP